MMLDRYFRPSGRHFREVRSNALGKEEVIGSWPKERPPKKLPRALDLSINSRNSSYQNLMRQLDLHSVADLTLYAMQNGSFGLLSAPPFPFGSEPLACRATSRVSVGLTIPALVGPTYTPQCRSHCCWIRGERERDSIDYARFFAFDPLAVSDYRWLVRARSFIHILLVLAVIPSDPALIQPRFHHEADDEDRQHGFHISDSRAQFLGDRHKTKIK